MSPKNVAILTDGNASTVRDGAVEKAVLVPGGNFAMVTLRERADVANAGTREVLCAAPSPDWATALAMAQQLQGSGGVTGGPSASLSASSSLTETISALAGRTAGVVGLRDGLYSACQMYANGVIGKDAYALILSQYGNLLVSLAGSSTGGGGSSPSGSSGSGGSGAAVAGTPVAVSVTTTAAPSGAPAASSSGAAQTGGASGGNTALAQAQQQILQALLVACINESDPTVRDNTQRNTLLTAGYCDGLFSNVQKAVPDLLKPANSGTTTTPNPAAKPVSDPKVAALQTELNKKGAGVTVDGIMGPKTLEAMTKLLGS